MVFGFGGRSEGGIGRRWRSDMGSGVPIGLPVEDETVLPNGSASRVDDRLESDLGWQLVSLPLQSAADLKGFVHTDGERRHVTFYSPAGECAEHLSLPLRSRGDMRSRR